MKKTPQKSPEIPGTIGTVKTNDDKAETAAEVTPATILAPSPLFTMGLSDPDALENVRRRAAAAKAARGRSSLRIPLGSTAGVVGGIAIPQ